MSVDDLENGNWGVELDGIFEACFAWLETGGNSATGSVQDLAGTEFPSPDDLSTTFNRVPQIGLDDTDEQGRSLLPLPPALPMSEPAGLAFASNPAGWPVTQDHWLDTGNLGSMGSVGMEYLEMHSSETPSSQSALSSPVDLGGLFSPTSPWTRSSYMSSSPMTIATGYESALLQNNTTVSESASPRPLAPPPRSRRPRNGSREIKERKRKRAGKTKREQRRLEKPEKCPVCGHGSQYDRDCKRHMKKHKPKGERKRVHCLYCPTSLLADHKYNVKRHIKKKHPDKSADADVLRQVFLESGTV